MMMDKLEYFIIDYTAYGGEPLHIIIDSIFKEDLCQSATEIIDSILNLFKKGYLKAYYCEGGKYRELSDLNKDKLLSYVKKHAVHKFTEFPENEYYFESTELSHKFLKKEDRPR